MVWATYTQEDEYEVDEEDEDVVLQRCELHLRIGNPDDTASDAYFKAS